MKVPRRCLQASRPVVALRRLAWLGPHELDFSWACRARQTVSALLPKEEASAFVEDGHGEKKPAAWRRPEKRSCRGAFGVF